ncbi:MAG: carbohydrate ABC transporter substrate-binding protein [Oscillospiraceae bacterium]|nr:carbohydrate ABC transporter substrate-binding protein [Oscillospiraceae bacterium]
MKKLLAICLVLALALSMAACGNTPASTAPVSTSEAAVSSEAAAPAEGKVLRIYCWNDEFQRRLTEFYPDYDDTAKTIGDVKVEWVMTPSDNNAYQNALDEALLNQATNAADEKIDLFLIEADYALKYTAADVDVAMDVVKDIGVTAADMAQQYQYTRDIVTDENGVQRGISWQGCPGVFIYRRSIAKDVLGTDDPVEVQETMANWDKFDETAATMAAKGYKMLGGYDDTYRTFSNNVSATWVNDKNEIVIDDAMMKWVDQTMEFTEKGYNAPNILWAPEWAATMGKDGKTFGYFGPAWFIDFVMAGNSMDVATADGGKAEAGNGAYGDYAACAGPAGYFWGGTWMCGATGSDNVSLIKDIMLKMCCDEATATGLTKSCNEFANNKKAMNAIAASDYGSAFLGGQNVIGAMAASADTIDMSKTSPYDQGLNEGFQTAFHDYFNGSVDKETALANFYKEAQVKYPELKIPA